MIGTVHVGQDGGDPQVYEAGKVYDVSKEESKNLEGSFEAASKSDEEESNQVDPNVPSLEWNRDKLEAHAKELGIEGAEDLPNKRAILEAIQAKQ